MPRKFTIVFHDDKQKFPFDFSLHKRDKRSDYITLPAKKITGQRYEIEVTTYPHKMGKLLKEEERSKKKLKVFVTNENPERIFLKNLPRSEDDAFQLAILWAKYCVVFMKTGKAEFDEVRLEKYQLSYRYTAA